MAKTQNMHARVTIYQLSGPCSPAAVLKSSYMQREDFAATSVTIGDRDCHWISGTITKERVSWSNTVAAWLNDEKLIEGLSSSTVAGVLLLPTSDSNITWAICFGLGFHVLEPGLIVQDLGRRIAVRCADPEQVRQVTYSKLDVRALVARTTIPGGDGIDNFGASDLGDFVSRIVGPANLDGLDAAEAGEQLEIRGADSISIPVARESSKLLSDLDAIESFLGRDPVPQLALVEQLKLLKSSDPTVSPLETQLDLALGDADAETLGLAWPTELAEVAIPFSRIEVSGLPNKLGGAFRSEKVDLESLLRPIRGLPDSDRMPRLKQMRVVALTDENEVAGPSLPALRWLIFEIELEGHRYCLHDGNWYRLDDGLNARVSQRIAPVFALPPPISGLPPWPVDMEEGEYNLLLAASLGGVCLDKKLIQCETSPRGFESCDVLTPDGVFVHVKKVGRSQGASHLFAQAQVSANILRDDSTARKRLRDRVEAEGGAHSWVPDRPKQTVLVMGNTRVLSASNLFSFSRVRLAHLAAEMSMQNVELSAIAMAYS